MKKTTARITMMSKMLGLILFSALKFPSGRIGGGGGGIGEMESFPVKLCILGIKKWRFGFGSPHFLPKIIKPVRNQSQKKTPERFGASLDVMM